MSDELAAKIERLRVGTAYDSHDVPMQLLYERALKEERWSLQDALPLSVGLAPEDWSAHVKHLDLHDTATQVFQQLLDEHGLDGADDLISVAQLVAWARRHAFAMPAAFSRLYEFIQSSQLTTAADDNDSNLTASDRALMDERLVVLGAALSVVTKAPEQCRDTNGFFDGGLIAALIMQTAARWFALGPPQMSETQMAALIEQYLA